MSRGWQVRNSVPATLEREEGGPGSGEAGRQGKGCSEGGAQGAHGWPLGEGQGKDRRVKLDKRTHASVLAGPWGTAGSRPRVAAKSPCGLLQSPLHLGLLGQGTSSLTQSEPGRPGREQGLCGVCSQTTPRFHYCSEQGHPLPWVWETGRSGGRGSSIPKSHTSLPYW